MNKPKGMACLVISIIGWAIFMAGTVRTLPEMFDELLIGGGLVLATGMQIA